MVERVVLHIGTMKSGTTYLQRGLETGVLESVGSFYAGGAFSAQTRAWDSLRRKPKRSSRSGWHEMAARVQQRDGVCVYSQEFMSFASKDQVRQIVESFGGAPVEVVLTVRDQRTAIPAQWQSFVRNRGKVGWEDYVRGLEGFRKRGAGRTARGAALRTFRRAQYVPEILTRWTSHPGVSAVSVVLVPPPGSPPQLLWQRFCEAARIEAPELPNAGTRHNESLGYPSCDLLRRLNHTMTGLSDKEHERARRAPVQALLPLRPQERRPELDRAGAALARELNKRILRAASRHDARLVGSPDELPVDGGGDEPPSIPPPDPDEQRRALDTLWTACAPGIDPLSGDADEVVTELGRRLAARFGS